MVTAAAPATLAPHDWQWQGHNIRYTVAGTGEPLLLIHGFGASIGHWRNNIPVLAAAGYQVYGLDLLGFGGSAKPALDYNLELWEAQIADFWQAHIGRPMVMVGNSIGGLLTLMVMAHRPKITQGGVLINCAGGLNHRPEELNPLLRLVMGTFTQLVSSPLIGPLVFNQIRQRGRIKNTLYQVYGDRTAVTDELVELLYQPSCDPGAQQVFASVLTAPPGPAPAELLPAIAQPLLILWGEADPWTPIAGSKIYQNLPQGEFHIIPKAGHCPHDETPDQVNALILQWLAAHGQD